MNFTATRLRPWLAAVGRTSLLAVLLVTLASCHKHESASQTSSGGAPVITAQPQSQTVTVGATATFSVVATGTAPLHYQWSKNGTSISGANSASYTTPPTAASDNGASFAVTVSNAAGSAISQSAMLTVSSGSVEPAITTQPQSQTVTVGATATFSVVATGTAPLHYQWSKNGTSISGANSASYITPPTAASDNGASFAVTVSNAAGSAISQSATLTVNAGTGPPVITSQPSSQTVLLGATATFSVVATGAAPLSYQWAKNGTAINGATGSSYTTPTTLMTDNGSSFAVKISNSAGSSVSSSATLTVTSNADVVTYHNDNARSGAYLTETALMPSNVNQAQFGLLRRLPVDGKVDAAPLVLLGFSISGASRNVVLVATEHDSVYAFDTDTGANLWQVSLLGFGEVPSDTRNCDQIVPEIGVTSTPVIDRAASKIFVVATSKDSSGSYHHRLHALSLTTGAETANSPVEVTASVLDTGAPFATNGLLVFDPSQYVERSALLLSQGVIYTSWSSHCDGPNYTGWIGAYGESSLQQTAIFNDEPSGVFEGGQGSGAFWNAGSGPSADASGNLYAMSANGVFDTTLTPGGFPLGNDYGNSILKLSVPTASTFDVLDYFTMYNTVSESAADVDLGSGGLMLLPDMVDGASNTRHLAIGAGKDETIYLVDRDNLGKFNPTDNSNAYQTLPNAFPNAGVFSAPVYFNGMVYFSAVKDSIRGYQFTAAQLPATATTVTTQQFAYPGTAMALSASGTSNGILWAVENSSTNAILHAFSASNLADELYNSNQAGTRDQFGPGSKFNPPTIANGEVFVGTQLDTSANPAGQNYVAVFGLLP